MKKLIVLAVLALGLAAVWRRSRRIVPNSTCGPKRQPQTSSRAWGALATRPCPAAPEAKCRCAAQGRRVILPVVWILEGNAGRPRADTRRQSAAACSASLDG